MKRQVLIVPILSCVLFTACFPASKSAHPQNNMSSLNVEEMNQSPYDNLTYQFSIPENYTQNIPEVQCKLKLFEGKDMESLFFGNTKQVYQKEETSESIIYIRHRIIPRCVMMQVAFCTPRKNPMTTMAILHIIMTCPVQKKTCVS